MRATQKLRIGRKNKSSTSEWRENKQKYIEMAKTYFVIRCALHNYWFYGRIITGEEKEKKFMRKQSC